MSSEIKKIYNLLCSVGFSSIGFIAAITVTALAVREVTTNPYLVGIPNALGVGGRLWELRFLIIYKRNIQECLL